MRLSRLTANCIRPEFKKTLRGSTARISSRRLATIADNYPPSASALNYTEDLFNFTASRFVRDEVHELSLRRVVFNVHELAQCAAKAIGARECIKIEKLPDDMSNRVMLLTMDDESQVVAKVPAPSAGPPHYTIASEVATMDFARTVLKIPTPQVYTWSSRADQNSVGAEFIVMEKVKGVKLETIWSTLGVPEKLEIVKALALFQKSWTSISFKKYGSLYYSEDLDNSLRKGPLYVNCNGEDVVDERFSIGPSLWYDTEGDSRAGLNYDRGPWTTLQAYHNGIGERERQCVLQVPELPKSPMTLFGPGTYIPTREKKLKALKVYMQLIEYLIPKDPLITASHIWHKDLHAGHIFVDPAQPTKIVSIIDWQSTELAPLYMQAAQPPLIDHDGPKVEGLQESELPRNFNELDDEAKQKARSIHYQRSICALFNSFTHQHSPRIFTALQFQETLSGMLLVLAQALLIDIEAMYLWRVVDMEATWNDLPGAKGSPYPFHFSEEELRQMAQDTLGALKGAECMETIKEALGELFPKRGVVKHDRYDEVLNALGQVKEQIIEQLSECEQDKELWEKMWRLGP